MTSDEPLAGTPVLPTRPAAVRVGRQTCGSLDDAASREWLVTDGLGGFAMGTVAGLRTRRYHGLLVVATQPPIGRQMALASLDAVVVLGDRRVRLATHQWGDGSISPDGYRHLASFELRRGVPRWRWDLGDVVIEREVAMARGRPATGIAHRVVRATGAVHLELEALCTWRDVHGERFGDGDPAVEPTADGFTFEGAYRVRGPGFEPAGAWYRGVRAREEAARGLNAVEDLWFAGRFVAELEQGESADVTAWAGDLASPPPTGASIVASARARADEVARLAGVSTTDDVGAQLAVAADQLVVAGPTVVAGYPWFGDWSRDTMTSYDGLLLATGRVEEGRRLLVRAAGSLSEGMLANTADAGGTEYNTVDGTLWFLHALDRHVAVTGDLDLASDLADDLTGIVDHHVAGTRFGIRVDSTDGLLTQGAEGWALTWMDARVDGRPITARAGKPVEVNALWVNGLAAVVGLLQRLGRDAGTAGALEPQARASFARRFAAAGRSGLADVVDGPGGDDWSLRPNQLLAVSLPHAPLRGADATAAGVVAACAPLVTSLGLRSLSPDAPGFRPTHRGGPAERDAAYHQGTVWPWLIGPYAEAVIRTGGSTDGILDGLEAHLLDWGLGSVSETADGQAPHGATGCPFQAWSVAELIRARALLAASG
jgi:predicted glycogen debranching enzyme